MNRRPYPSDVSDEEWDFVAPYLSLLPQTAAQRRHELREVFNAVRSIVRTGAPWRWLPTNFPPWEAVYQRTRRWIAASSFEAIVHDLRLLVRVAAGRRPQPSTAMVDSRTLRSTVESGQRAGVDGQKRVRSSKVHAVVDTMGTLLALRVTPANEAERRQISALAQRVREVTGETVEVLYADAAYTGEETETATQEQGMRLVVVQRPEGSHGVWAPAQTLGRGTQLRVAESLPSPRPRLRAPSRHASWAAVRRLHLSLAPSITRLAWWRIRRWQDARKARACSRLKKWL
jgi:transposase